MPLWHMNCDLPFCGTKSLYSLYFIAQAILLHCLCSSSQTKQDNDPLKKENLSVVLS